ncbi:tyrosine-type recombinase/integrase [Candidatus Gromoviella agglomerans]|uniref:tyrosine-type recombinase/integrase n=1 Tax=Candidatus Gromoviella agglomerans TaxID=2806609 RepID=UPI001E2ECC32|nr:tyrosine-type recombinase/integrase [Candidatus Gromoviella agglomerans]UFX98318.1 Site-specific tyrosine recombinase XerC [Candidatus Gromoviella agglomerans]
MQDILQDEVIKLLTDYESWILHEKAYAKNTLFNYKNDIKSLLMFMFDKQKCKISLRDIKMTTPSLIREFMTSKIICKNSKKRTLSSIKSLHKFMIKKKILSESHILCMEQGKGEKPIPKPISYEEIVNIINNSPNKLARAVFFSLYATGLRISELLSLRLTDLTCMIQKREIIVKGKGEKERLVPIISKQIKLIIDYLSEKYKIHESEFENLIQQKSNEFIFSSKRNVDKPLSARYIQIIMKTIIEKNGIHKRYTPHSFRHSFASHMIEDGAPIRHVQELMGHKSIRSTQIYTKIDTRKFIANHQKFHPRNNN